MNQLQLCSAKIWMHEKAYHRVNTGEHPVELNAQRWVHNRGKGLARAVLAWDGCRAFKVKYLTVKGAFVDGNGRELIHKDKKDRAQQLHNYGFT